MGTRIVDTASGTVLASATGNAYTDDLAAAFDSIAVELGNERKRANAEKFIIKAKLSADSINKLAKRLDGMRTEHAKIIAAIGASVPDGFSVSYQATTDGAPLVPVTLVDDDAS